MRNLLIRCTIALSLAVSADPGAAQSPERVGGGPFEFRAPVLPFDGTLVGSPTLRERVLTGLAGAVLGAGLGYFASQIATGDWEQGDGHGGVHRQSWAAVGSVGGLVLGFSIPLGSRSSRPGEPFPFDDDRFTIRGDEIREAMVVSALEAVETFHPEWLNLRGPDSFVPYPNDRVKAYLDNIPLGNAGELAGIETSMIEYIRFFDSRKATARWGMGHPHGAIQVVTLGGGSPH